MSQWHRRLQQWAALPWPLKLLGWGSLLLSMLGVGYPLSIGPELAQLQRARSLGESLQRRHAEEVAALEPLQGLDEQVRQARQRLQETHWRLAAGDDVVELVAQLSRHGHQYGLRFERIDVKDEQPGEGYRAVPVHLEVVGTYPVLRRWLDEWLDQLRLLRLERLDMRLVDPASTTLRWQVVVHAYQSDLPALPVPAMLAHQPARADEPWTGRDPFQAFGTQGAQGLTHLPLEQLTLVGVLARRGQYQAILDANGYLHRVAVGDRVGREGGRVLSIDARRVRVGEAVTGRREGLLARQRELRLRGGTTKDRRHEQTGMGDGRGHDGRRGDEPGRWPG